MELKQQVVSLELAKKLKELGVKQDSFFGWIDVEDSHNVKPELRYNFKDREDRNGNYDNNLKDHWEQKVYSAFTVAELGEMLPNWIGHPILFPSKIDNPKIMKEKWFGTIKAHSMAANTEADARAKMLIYLLENNLINKDK